MFGLLAIPNFFCDIKQIKPQLVKRIVYIVHFCISVHIETSDMQAKICNRPSDVSLFLIIKHPII